MSSFGIGSVSLGIAEGTAAFGFSLKSASGMGLPCWPDSSRCGSRPRPLKTVAATSATYTKDSNRKGGRFGSCLPIGELDFMALLMSSSTSSHLVATRLASR